MQIASHGSTPKDGRDDAVEENDRELEKRQSFPCRGAEAEGQKGESAEQEDDQLRDFDEREGDQGQNQHRNAQLGENTR